jgi:DNA-binding MarR family transcriptional regulator
VQADDLTAVADAVLLASRVLVAVAVESLAEVDGMSLPQFRILTVLTTRGEQNVGSLAEILGINPSTATRLCDRLAERELVLREHGADDRREVRLSATESGRELVEAVIDRRRRALARVVERMPPDRRLQLVEAMQAFGEAAGEVPHQPWSIGWTSPG